jgi:nucleotide-binding universal stress UspA family protein
MPLITKILVATDFQAPAQAALDWALELGRALGASVLAVHVFDLPLVGLPDASLMVSAKAAARLSDEAQAALDQEIARVRGRGIPVEGILRQGDARDVVPALAEELNADVIVVGTHGRRGLARALLGSTAESIERVSPKPVVVVHPRST